MVKLFVYRWLPLLGLLLFAGLALYLTHPPPPVPANAPTTAFSAERALREVAVIARQPHSIGTPDHDRVRDYLVQRCRALGLRAAVQDTTVVTGSAGILVGARVQNVVALLPGRTPGGPAVLVLTHYDSQPHTPGASDDGAGVAAALETLRALHAGPPLEHDVRWVFTDGEEAELLGAHAYAADTAQLRRAVGIVLNFEARGNAGPSFLFEVSSGNGWVTGEFAKAVPVPLGSSLFYEIYRYLPNSTDFTAFRAAGLPGLNFAFVDGYAYYHSPVDTPGRLDLGSLQHQGEYMLPLVRHFASIRLAHAPTTDSTFFNPLGIRLVFYDGRWNYLLNLIAGLLLLAAVAQARRRGRLRLRGLLGGAGVWLGSVLLLVGTGWVLTRLVVIVYPQYEVFYDHAFYNVRTYHLAFVALGTALFGAYYAAWYQWLRPDSLAGGVLLVLASLQAVVQLKAPTSGFLLGFPLLFGALGWLWSLRTTGPAGDLATPPLGPQNLSFLGRLLVLPAMAMLTPTLSFLLLVAGLGPLILPSALFLAVLLGLLLPVLQPLLRRTSSVGLRASWVLPLLAGTVAVGALAAGHRRSRPTAEQPQQTHIWYLLDADLPQAYWLSDAPHADAWTQQFFSAPALGPMPALFPGSPQPVLHQAAERLALAPPTVEVLSDSTLPTGRRLRLQVRPGRPGVMSLCLTWPRNAHLQQLRVAGHAIPKPDSLQPNGTHTSLTFFAPGPAGIRLELETASRGPYGLLVVDRSLGLPAPAGTRALPVTMIPAPGYDSFTTQVKKRFRL